MRSLALMLTACALVGTVTLRAQDGAACEQAGSQPLLPRSSPNRIPNPHVAGSANWTLSSGAAIDATMSRTKDGSGSIDISAPGSSVQSFPISVVPGKTYTFSAYLQSTEWPTLAYMVIGIRDSSQRFLTTANSDYQGTTAANRWQEIAVTYTAASDEAFVNLQIGRHDASRSPSVAGKMWVDDLYFGEGISFEQPFAPKIPFDGGMVKVDELGNFTVLMNGDWTPYFPFCVYGDSSPDFQPYSDQGFNCLMRNWFLLSTLERAKNAVSAFNPNGMTSMLEIGQYLLPEDNPTYNNLPDLSSKLERVMQSPLLGSVLGFYWDNEEWNQYEVPFAVTELVKQANTADGRRLHPIYMLDGSQADSRVYGQLIDVVGDYLRDGPGPLRDQSTLDRFPISFNIEGQSRPVGIAIISQSTVVGTITGLQGGRFDTLGAGPRVIQVGARIDF